MDEISCNFCKNDENQPRYLCPRCNMRYCSMVCYKSTAHQQCSEKFYKEWVNLERESMGGNDLSRQQMTSFLQKHYAKNDDLSDLLGNDNEDLDSDDDDDDDEEEEEEDEETTSENLKKRFANVNLEDDNEMWDALTETERKQFIQMLGDGDILRIVPPWIPWWIVEGETMPTFATNIPDLKKIIGNSSPPSNTAYHILNAISSYLVTSRLLKGEINGFCVEAATAMWKLSNTLRDSSAECGDSIQCKQLLQEQVNNANWLSSSSGVTLTLDFLESDLVEMVKHGSTYFHLALSDMLSIFKDSISVLKLRKPLQRFTGEPPTLVELEAAVKQITFFIAWTKMEGAEVWDIANPVRHV